MSRVGKGGSSAGVSSCAPQADTKPGAGECNASTPVARLTAALRALAAAQLDENRISQQFSGGS